MGLLEKAKFHNMGFRGKASILRNILDNNEEVFKEMENNFDNDRGKVIFTGFEKQINDIIKEKNDETLSYSTFIYLKTLKNLQTILSDKFPITQIYSKIAEILEIDLGITSMLIFHDTYTGLEQINKKNISDELAAYFTPSFMKNMKNKNLTDLFFVKYDNIMDIDILSDFYDESESEDFNCFFSKAIIHNDRILGHFIIFKINNLDKLNHIIIKELLDILSFILGLYLKNLHLLQIEND